MIEELRSKIDAIDDKIAALYLERQAVVREIGEEKAANRKAVADPSREKKIIARVTKQADESQKMYLKRVFETIMETSRSYQRQIVTPVTPLTDALHRVLMEGKNISPSAAPWRARAWKGVIPR